MAQSSSSSSTQSSFQGIEDPQALAQLVAYLNSWASGGTQDYLNQRAARNTQIGDTRALQQDYSGEAAIYDAAALMEDQVVDTYRKSMPAITRAIQGAGTSAGSMQGLLATQLATDTAREAAALGAQQKTQYGQISANLANTLEGLTRIDNTVAQNLINGLNLMRIGRSSGSSTSTSSSTPDGGGGGGSSRAPSGGGGRGTGGGGMGGGYSNTDIGGYPYGTGTYVGTDYTGRGAGNTYYTGGTPGFYDDWSTGSDGAGGMAGSGYSSFDEAYYNDPNTTSGNAMDYGSSQGAAYSGYDPYQTNYSGGGFGEIGYDPSYEGYTDWGGDW